MFLIGLDVGTQGTKAVLYDDEKKTVVKRAVVKYDVLPSDVPGRAEQDPETWMAACMQTVEELLEDREDVVSGIGVSGQQHGLVALDENGIVLRPAKLWCDVESSQEARDLSRQLGTVLVPSLTLTKILWMKNNEPEKFARLHTVLLPHDYINFRLTGRRCMECGDASGTGAFDLKNRQFDIRVMKLVDPKLPDLFPSLISPNEAVGKLTVEVAKELSLTEDVVVAPGSGDNMMSALGSGAVIDGVVVLSLGTSGTLFGCSSKPIVDESGIVCPFCDATGRWLPLVCTISCTSIIEEIRNGFDLDHETLTRLAAAEPIGCRGVNFLPYLSGERTPNWPDAKGTLLGLTPGTLRPGLLYRAALEGATFTLLNGLRRMEALGMTAKELRVVGGGSRNLLWRRIVADAFGIPLQFPSEPESAALGGALQAGAVVRGIPITEYDRFIEDALWLPGPLFAGEAKLDDGTSVPDSQVRHTLQVPLTEATKELEKTEGVRTSEDGSCLEAKTATDAKAKFFCEPCGKQYQTAMEWDVHLSSYDHHHKKRWREMNQMFSGRNKKQRLRKEQKQLNRDLDAYAEQFERARKEEQSIGASKAKTEPKVMTAISASGSGMKFNLKSGKDTVKHPPPTKTCDAFGDDSDSN